MTSAHCPACGAEAPPRAGFCPTCGAALSHPGERGQADARGHQRRKWYILAAAAAVLCILALAGIVVFARGGGESEASKVAELLDQNLGTEQASCEKGGVVNLAGDQRAYYDCTALCPGTTTEDDAGATQDKSGTYALDEDGDIYDVTDRTTPPPDSQVGELGAEVDRLARQLPCTQLIPD